MDSISKKIGNKYKDWTNPDGSLILSKEINGKTVLHPVLEGYFMSLVNAFGIMEEKYNFSAYINFLMYFALTLILNR